MERILSRRYVDKRKNEERRSSEAGNTKKATHTHVNQIDQESIAKVYVHRQLIHKQEKVLSIAVGHGSFSNHKNISIPVLAGVRSCSAK